MCSTGWTSACAEKAERRGQAQTGPSGAQATPARQADRLFGRQPTRERLFIVEGDSAGGSAKQARDRKTQAILPIRGKILNVASATSTKILQNQEIADLTLAMGCGTRKDCDPTQLRYEKIVIMTDAAWTARISPRC